MMFSRTRNQIAQRISPTKAYSRIAEGLQHLRHRDKVEKKKAVISRSPSLIAWQCFLHLLPVASSIGVAYVNSRRFYIGVDFPDFTSSDTSVILLLQLAAKVHEMLIVASISQVIWHGVRNELLNGEGIPLGLLGSGLAFSQFEYYFKKDFLGSLKYLGSAGKISKQKLRRIAFVVLLIICGLTANLAGPASAVLLVPKSQDYSAGSSNVYLNGSAEDFWPSDLSGNVTDLAQICSGSDLALLDVCPAGGFVSLWERWSTASYQNLLRDHVPQYANSLSGSRFYWPMQSRYARLPPLYVLGDPLSVDQTSQPYTWLVQAHAASAVVLNRLTNDWWQALLAKMRLDPLQVQDRDIKALSRNPIAAVKCTDAQNISATQKEMNFPVVLGRWYWGSDMSSNISSTNVTRSNNLRFRWIPLPESFGAVSIGAMFEMPWTPGSDTRVVIGCSMQTGWIPAALRTDSYTFWSGWYPYGLQYGQRTPVWDPGSPSPTNGRIALGSEWLALLTPEAPSIPEVASDWTPSTIEAILASAGAGDIGSSSTTSTQADAWNSEDQASSGGRKRLLETIIASVLVDGLSRSGAYRVFQNLNDTSDTNVTLYEQASGFSRKILRGEQSLQVPSGNSEEYSTLEASMLISGYAYEPSLSAYLAMGVLLAHAIIAISHTFYLLILRRTSQSWDSVAELVALAQNSAPSITVLKNTGAGIDKSGTFAAMAKVRVTKSCVDGLYEHLELQFPGDRTREEEQTASRDDSISMHSVQVLADDNSGHQDGPHASWTFPIDRTERSRFESQSHSHFRSDSMERLLRQRRFHRGDSKIVTLDEEYS